MNTYCKCFVVLTWVAVGVIVYFVTTHVPPSFPYYPQPWDIIIRYA